ncbi:1-deoxy-D-xylulose 5-phosphate reductoisomerase [Psychromonas ingrahamii 37]|uniref:1-deoxy-D-xylulose 5-phosphate reductoisomerase n=1 Tax=Psychromonas ingrahamii (strain DSM 17664 / CCUG 51855 / 37) TaxID=357804 RepID=DXR_PSYIN|nr:1-deoxy-D-xylulose-5-phosphate reductoisomerase [Psychromonas ingrahamii]A1SYV7.1 RecName: Full=1-deoxy-D-xylulose 5-phosphate reductoisomerase; Short=DXP reductoisomerase; AltName: Full=1-deoxyxylulose-5-phosphate reductoisomerase; AltName: Full=2-C-methyl-D-erythritol 4-phosphate synthase [Psychromonas ingrahamii 37]ABM04672.1 1-deoxy-D-xylulose 5-phosphate reductoisomerase [Psychromonas ingrahamii 37]
MKKLAILGATGSIGDSTLSVCRSNPELYQITLLAASSSVDKMLALCREFTPLYVSMSSEISAKKLRGLLKRNNLSCHVLDDEQRLLELLASDHVDSVMAAIVGAAGLKTTLAAVDAGKEVFLANKEALVMSGALFIDAVKKSGAKLWPVDSEHNAIYQALSPKLQNTIGACDLSGEGVSKILLTGSGGPFLEKPLAEFAAITPAQAVKHPNWSMGKKISIDSATMMNKGLEYIEARWLFNANKEQLQIIIHPQSVIHSMVQYKDGSVIAQMGNPNMRIPIAYVLGGEQRIESGTDFLDFFAAPDFSFTAPDFDRYPCLKLAIDACFEGQQSTTILNAANEIAVEAFLNQTIKFTQISQLVERVLNQHESAAIESVEHLLEIDTEARLSASEIIKRDYLC